MNGRDLGSWLRDEHVKVNNLMEQMAASAAIVPMNISDRWMTELRERFDPLRAHMVRHMALEEEGGYLAGVLERRPALSREVERLQNEHRDLLRIMDQIHATLQEITAENRLQARDCCGRIKSLLGYLEEHHRHVDTIVISAFSEDIGAED